jgi:L-fuconolactonase
MPPATIDIHPHIVAGDIRRYPRAPLGGKQSDWSQTRPVSLEQMIAAMDQAGVRKAAIVQASTCYGHDNSYVADAVAAHPQRFIGMRLFTFGTTMSEQASWLDDPKSYPAWDYAGQTGLSICMQMSAMGLPQLTAMVERFPEVKVVLDHAARPQLEDGPPYAAASSLFALARHPNIYLKLTPRVFNEANKGNATPETFFAKLVAEFGAARLAWGSNYPSSEGSFPELLALARQSLSSLPQQDQDWIFAKTAQTLYPALADRA